MELERSAEDRAFEHAVRAFIDRHWGHGPEAARATAPRPSAVAERAWFDALVAQGWSVPHWPVAHGGTGWRAAERYLWERETARAQTPRLDPAGADVVGPLLCALGTPEQQRAHLPRIREARVRWCLALDADTDVVRTADHRLRGELPAVPGAGGADWMLCRVRLPEAADRQCLYLVALEAPGVRRTPVAGLDGRAGPATVTLEDVAAGADRAVAPARSADDCLALLASRPEARPMVSARLSVDAGRLRALAETTASGHGGALAGEADFARRLAELELDLAGLNALELRRLAAEDRGSPEDVPAAALALRRQDLRARIAELAVAALGYYGLAFPDPRMIDNEGPIGHDYALTAIAGMLRSRAAEPGQGISETHKNTLARSVLGV
ncbi:MAG: acyl-CoA dehydrogenase family protein [Pseudomonadota bacterium]